MRVHLVTVGRKDPFAAHTDDYLRRAARTGRASGLSGFELSAVEAPRALSGAVRQAREAELLTEALPERARVVLLDERGEDLGSEGMARLVERERDGAPDLAFLIGGADGFAGSLTGTLGSRAAGRIAFGRAVWPHMLVRLMLAEQLYRATTILAGHPYHRA